MSQDVPSDEGSSLDLDELEPVEVTEEQMQTLMELERCLQNIPADYEAHVRYVALLRTCRLREKLREARYAFQEVYPLTENMWLEWVEDESEALETMDDVVQLEALLWKSHDDYMSVSLWKEHIQVSMARFEQRKAKGDAESVAAGAVREVFDEALADCGFHVIEGASLWNLCLDFELNTLQGGARDDARIEGLFRKFLSCPFPSEVLLGARARYVAWLRGDEDVKMIQDEDVDLNKDHQCGEGVSGGQEEAHEEIPRALEKTIERAIRAYELRRGHEEAIVAAREMDPQGITLLSAYASYLELEASSGAGSEDSRVRTVFERAIVEFPTSDYLWKSYIGWIDAKSDQLLRPSSQGQTRPRSESLPVLVGRALRNCPWSGDVWALHFETLDSPSDAAKELERCRLFLGGSASEFQKAVVAYVSCWSRALDSIDAQHKDSLLRECISASKEQKIVDPEHRCAWLLSSMLAEGQGADGGSRGGHDPGLEAGMAIWEALIAEGTLESQYSGTWMSYYWFLVRFGAGKPEKRSVFQRAMRVHMAAADKSYIARAWLSFEEREGSREDFCQARRATADVLRRAEATQRGISLELDQVTASLAEMEKRKRRQENDPNFSAAGNKKGIQGKGTRNKAGKGSNGRKARDQRNLKEGVPTKKRKANTAGPTDHGNIGAKEAHMPSEISDSQFGRDLPNDERFTVFIKYIEASVTEDELSAELASCGSDMEISLARDSKTGRSKGFAYVQCSKETSNKLCGLNGKEYRGKRLLIAPSDPVIATKKRRGKGGGKGDGKRMSQKHVVNHPKPGQRTKLGGGHASMLVPRGAVTPTTNTGGATDAPKSNDDFRKMFVKR